MLNFFFKAFFGLILHIKISLVCVHVSNHALYGGRFPRVFGDKFGEEFCDKFGDEFSESPNLVMN